ncbi:Pyruvate:ferredoxin oxidoreductase, gamma subunit [Desulfurella amilsii]|uniref:Pyruvate:ferredoxin oxidoreductase, gamma subunit n=1 Tax=Desulfurella amilsii TaxID=1562698 RepID=A0A1X4XX14_9BACT|nr:2-oxoacid:acceptor oxidoreductase family protein [Desulfurella amilsii]OSS42073.1 Pyruvate:ferredoxin oxidoreductase, gamma subunit [Desulfurella amilsii]
MKHIGLHGRGGQGVVVAGEILAQCYFDSGKYVQFMPSYGAERRGSPSHSYIRVDDSEIYQRYPIESEDIAVIFSLSVIDTAKLKENGFLIANAANLKVKEKKVDIYAVDANDIALSLGLGSSAIPIINTTILGAYCKITNDFSFDTLALAIKSKIDKKADLNIQGAKLAYDSVRCL